MTQAQIKFAAGLAGIQAKHECGFEGRDVADDPELKDHFYRHTLLVLDRWGIEPPEGWPLSSGKERGPRSAAGKD